MSVKTSCFTKLTTLERPDNGNYLRKKQETECYKKKTGGEAGNIKMKYSALTLSL